ncbi:MAG: DUF1573 domain-containing protein [Planctomycetota bacterium]|nr:DUF1573 domain-containing protein [Planctomycetaceae bacterium]MDQ3332944.1 DUF1573 domain-containing protein [Planctomycetota bacterium]
MKSAPLCRSGRVELTVGLLLLAGIVGAGIGLALARSTPVAPGVTVSPADLDFGSAWEQPAYRHEFTLSNPTDQPIRFAEIKTGCGCTRVEPQSFTMEPGASRTLAATLNLVGRGGSSFSVDLLPLLAHQPPGDRTVWTLRGKVQRNPIALSQPSIDFGDEVILSEPLPTREIEISLADEPPFEDLQARIVEGDGQVTLETLEDGRWRLLAKAPDDLPLGPFTFTVRVEPTVASSRPVPFREVVVTGTVRDDVAAWPSRVNFGVLELGKTGREYVVLSSHRGRPFEVTKIETPEGVTVALADEQLGDGGKTFVVEQQSTGKGDRKSQFVFHIRRLEAREGETDSLSIAVKTSHYGMSHQR